MTDVRVFCERPSESLAKISRLFRESHSNHRFVRLRDPQAARRRHEVIINWGSSQGPSANSGLILNPPTAVDVTSNKRSFMNLMSGIDMVPMSFISYGDTVAYILSLNDTQRAETKFVLRDVLKGHSGQGIRLLSAQEVLEYDADRVGTRWPRLVTLYMKKEEEYRVHFYKASNGVINIARTQQKFRNRDVPNEDVNWQIRNHHTGFIYGAVRDMEIATPKYQSMMTVVNAVAIRSCLDFGAMDLIYHRNYGFRVLEINTAPGLEGESVSVYASMFLNFAQRLATAPNN